MAKTWMGQVHSADIDKPRVRFKVPLTVQPFRFEMRMISHSRPRLPYR